MTEERRDRVQAYAAEHGLAFDTGPDVEAGTFYATLLEGDEGAPQWTSDHIQAVEELLAA